MPPDSESQATALRIAALWLRLAAAPSLLRPKLLAPIFAVCFAASFCAAAPQDEIDSAPSEALEFFETQVQPLLQKHCIECHGEGDSAKGGLRLTSRRRLLEGGGTGPAVSLDHPAESLLLEAINYESYEMPPSGKLPQEQIDILTRWVEMGAPWTTAEEPLLEAPEEPDPTQLGARAQKHWAFQSVKRPELPEVNDTDWISNSIDAFVLARLESAGLAPAPPADKVTLLRRAYYDLTGLPPEPEDVAAFLADDSPDAFEAVIDRLLQSPHYGERWARHWLDLVRYAETNSYERDGAKPYVWRYRDYVIRSLNEDKPYDQFIVEQLAGDELPNSTPDSIIATGYYRLGVWQDEPVDPVQVLYDDLDDLVRTTGEVFLGMTIGCARCHDHKLDPIPQRDYYRFLAFFRNVRRYGVRAHETVLDASVRSIASPEQQRKHDQQVRAHQREVKQNQQQLSAIEEKLKADLVGVEKDDWETEAARLEIAKKRVGSLLSEEQFDRYVQLSRRRDELREFKPPGLDQALCVKEHGRESPPTHVLVRGNAHVAGEEVQPGFPTVLGGAEPAIEPPPSGIQSTGRRLALGRWLASSQNPLTPRVMVNRIWQYHFGRGLVRTSSDFGLEGSPPTHPQLLDWLASEFVNGGWKMKRLHKQIMLSSTYQMSSRPNDRALEEDPTNDLLWRYDMRRLSAEEIRDSILAVNGSLNRGKMYGPSMYPTIPPEVLAGQSRPGEGWDDSPPKERARRSIYIHVKRSLIVPMIASFDGPDTDSSCPVRFKTTQPTQALGMLNSDFVNKQAKRFARFLRREAGSQTEAQVRLALLRSLQRQPTAEEIERGVRLVKKLQSQHQLSEQKALSQFCVTMLNLNEFIYLD